MVTNEAGLGIIKFSESLFLKAYLCPASVWTIGWGTTRYPNGSKVRDYDGCTPELAESWLQCEVGMVERQIKKSVKVDLTENQFSALVSLVYNIGITHFNKSTLRKNLNGGDYEGASEQFLVWRKAGGKVLRGLEIRRATEKALFDS